MADARPPSSRIERLGLDLPALRPGTGREPDLRPRAIARWLQSLPLASAEQATERLSALLAKVSTTELAASARFGLAEQVRGTALALYERRGATIVSGGVPLSGRAEARVEQARTLLSTLTDTYKWVVVQAHEAGTARERDLLAHAILRTVELLQRALALDYRLYAPPARGAWAQLHRVYALAEEAGVARQLVGDTAASGDSVALAYRRALLIALANPHRLRPADYPRLQQLAGRYAEQLRLHGTTRPGGAVASPDGNPALAQAPALDLSAVAARAAADLARGEDALLRALLPAWSTPPRRRFGRRPHLGAVRVVLGLGALAWALRPPSETTGTTSATPLTLSLEPHAPRASIDDDSRHFAATLPAWHAQRRRTPPPLPTPAHREYALTSLDVSPGGQCLLWEGREVIPAQVGDLVGIWDPLGQRWNVAVLRWILYLRERGLRMGLHLLAAEVEDARLHSNGREVLALHLPGGQGPRSLLVEPGRFHPGRVLRLELGGHHSHVRLEQALEATGGFIRFSYHPLGEIAGPAAALGLQPRLDG